MKTLKLFLRLVLLLAALIFATGGRGAAVAAYAYSWVFPTYKQEMVTHKIKDGETLYSIAALYAGRQDKWDDLRGVVIDIQDANGIGDNDARWLRPGQKILVPLKKQVRE